MARQTLVNASVLILVLLVAACSNNSSTSTSAGSPVKSAATITATPNPVSTPTQFGSSTISWDTGDGTIGQVYVAEGSGAEKLFADGQPRGSLDAPWIGVGATYVFRLYSGQEHKNLLASVKVMRADK
jgi:flagellar basal body L-ring protein FlgH